MKKFKKVITLVLCFAMVLGLAACGSDSNVSSPSPSASTSENDSQVGSEPKYQERIIIGSNGGIVTTDPHAQNNVTHGYMFQCTHENLLYFNMDTLKLEPMLAKEYKWRDNTTLEFTLNTDVTFHNGEHLSAEDVVYSIERVRELYPGNVGTIEVVEKVVAEDNDTVLFYVPQHVPDLPLILSDVIFYIVNKKACETDPDKGFEIGTGPYKIVSMTPSEVASLERYEGYWGGMPKTKYIDIKYIGETSARLIALQNGEIDVCIQPNNNELDIVKNDANLALHERDSITFATLHFNVSKPPCDDVNLRLAVAYAINQDDIIQVAVEGYGVPGTTYWGPKTFGYYDGFANNGYAYGQNLELAKEYAAKAKNKSFKIAVSTTERKKMAEAIQAMCAEVGIEVIVDTMETAAINTAMSWDVAEHDAAIYNSSWAVYGDVSRLKFYPRQGANRSIVNDSRINELIDSAATEKDETKRLEMYKEIQIINHEQCYNYPLFLNKFFAAAKKDVQGVVWSHRNNHIFKGAYIEIK